jgi:hypothetical protein
METKQDLVSWFLAGWVGGSLLSRIELVVFWESKECEYLEICFRRIWEEDIKELLKRAKRAKAKFSIKDDNMRNSSYVVFQICVKKSEL